MFRKDLHIDPDIATITFFGNAAEIDPGIIREVRQALDKNVRIILIDMSRVSFIDARGIRTILGTIRYAGRRDGRIFLTDIPPVIQRIISLNTPGIIIPRFETKREAIKEIAFNQLEEYTPPKTNILIVENHGAISNELATFFKDHRLWYTYRIKTAPLDHTANSMVADVHPALIITDARLATDSVLGFIQWLKSDPVHWYIPVLVASHEGMIKKALHMVENGADDLLMLPLRHQELNAKLQFAIQMNNIVKREKLLQIEAESTQRI